MTPVQPDKAQKNKEEEHKIDRTRQPEPQILSEQKASGTAALQPTTV